MKKSASLLCSLILATSIVGCSNSGGEDNTTTPPAPTPPANEPSGGVGDNSGGTVSDTGDSYTFSLEVFVSDENGKAVVGLKSSKFDVAVDKASDNSLSIDSVSPSMTTKNGPFSSALLLDQSGSMKVNDPFDLRVDSTKVFYSLINTPNNSALFAFAGSGDRQLPDTLVQYSAGYVSNIDDASVDVLKDLEGGWSPIFDSAYNVLTDLRIAPNAHKALVILSDGDNYEPLGTTYSASDVVTYANDNSISIHTVALSEDADVEVLSTLAQKTGGSYTLVLEASQLNSAMSALASLLRGDRQVYDLVLTAQKDSGVFASGDVIKGNVTVSLDSGEVVIPFLATVE